MGLCCGAEYYVSAIEIGEKAMAYPIEKHEKPNPKPAPALPEWVAVYYSPEAPANLSKAPGLNALDQMYAYYDA